MKLSDIRDNFLHVEQKKTRAKVAFPLFPGWDATNMTIKEIIGICRDNIDTQSKEWTIITALL